MKAILIVCLLLASIFFIPSSNAAEEKCDPYSRRSCRLKPPARPLKPIAPPLKPPTPPMPGKCGRGSPYRRCISSPPLPQSPPLKPPAPPLKPPTPPLKPPTPPTPGPPYRKPTPPSGCTRTPYRRCAPPTP